MVKMDDDIAAWFEDVIDRFNRDNTRLSDWELGFFKDQIERWGKYGQDIRLSDRQWEFIDRIAQKLGAPKRGQPEPDQELSDEIPF